jgi:lysozyme
MSSILPRGRPKLTQDDAQRFLSARGVKGPALLGIRGYYLDTMGVAGKNDVNLYDDAIALVTPTVFRTFNANTDPSKEYPGVATLIPGTWEYMRGIHNISKDPRIHPRYPCLVQAAPVIVYREGTEEYETNHEDPHYGRSKGAGRWIGDFGIHIHRGGLTTTSSEGCQTIHPLQWNEFWTLVDAQMLALGITTVPYCLMVTEQTS